MNRVRSNEMRSNACAKRGSNVMCMWEKGEQGRRSLFSRHTWCARASGERTTRTDVRGGDCHETMQPLVNHLVNASGSLISRIPRHACNPTNQLLFNCSIQWTTKRRRSSGDFTGKSLAFSVSSMGRACESLDQRSRTDGALHPRIYGKNTDHGHPVTEVGWVGRHGTVYVT